MKYFTLSPDAGGHIDPPVDSMLRQIQGLVDSVEAADVVLVPITKFREFKLNPKLNELSRPWVLVDYVENGWDWDQEETMVFGRNTAKFFGGDYNEEWAKFDQFITDHPPILTFKRELLERDRTYRIIPIEYTHWLPEHGLDSPEEFKKRTLEVSFNWGRSSEARMLLHAAIFSEAGRFGYDVVSQWNHVEKAIADNAGSLKWLSVHVPHYDRIDVREVQKYIRKSRVTLLAGGCGVKTFRHGEVCQDALMAIPANKLAWSYPWTSENSVVLPEIRSLEDAREAVKAIADALMNPYLYLQYAQGVDNGRNYAYQTYLRRWVEGNIERCVC